MPGHIDLKSETDTLRTLDAQLAQGEEVLLTRDGQVVARVTPVAPPPTEAERQAERERMAALRRSAFGMFAGQIEIAPDAFDPDPEIEDLFYADNLFPAPDTDPVADGKS